jgi:hypothetical protein
LRIDIPLYAVSVMLWRKGLESVRFSNGSALAVCFLLVGLVMAMVGVEQILDLADLAFEVRCFGFYVVQTGICEMGEI